MNEHHASFTLQYMSTVTHCVSVSLIQTTAFQINTLFGWMCHQSHSFFLFPTHRHQILNLFENHFSFNYRHSLIHSSRNHLLYTATLCVSTCKDKRRIFSIGYFINLRHGTTTTHPPKKLTDTHPNRITFSTLYDDELKRTPTIQFSFHQTFFFFIELYSIQ
jgi:hypothetical protein